MAIEADPISDEDLVALFQADDRGARLSATLKGLPKADAAALGRRCADLHNQGRLDFLALAGDPTLTGRKDYELFEFDYFFDPAIADLDISIDAMMRFIPAVAQRAAGLGLSLGGFKAWCQRDPARWGAVADAVKAGDAVALPFLSAALQASDDLNLIDQLLALGGEPRAIAIQALGWLSSTGDLPRRRLGLLTQALEDDDEINAGVVHAALRTADQVNPLLQAELETILAEAIDRAGPAVIRQLAQMPIVFPKQVSAGVVPLMLAVLDRVDASDDAAVALLDDSLSFLVAGAHADEAIAFASRFLAKPENPRTLDDLEDFTHALARSEHRDRALVGWLLEGRAATCNHLMELLASEGFEGPVLEPALEAFGLSPAELLYLCRKAVGFLFIKPVSVASILIAALRQADEVVGEALAELLFDPMLLNYPGAVGRYLASVGSDDAAFASVQKALALDKTYEDAIGSVGEVRELAMSEDERQTRLRVRRDESRRIQKAAKARSIFAGLIPESQILHGTRVRSVVRGLGGGKPNVIETTMHSHGYSWEMARGLIADPLGVQYRLFRFKAESKPQ
ncbi:hypothetical protein AS593_06850 [Caulobacter vibrioides]|nr:hypothetical protein AS593_06850 [Caulobacter vibrioides]